MTYEDSKLKLSWDTPLQGHYPIREDISNFEAGNSTQPHYNKKTYEDIRRHTKNESGSLSTL